MCTVHSGSVFGSTLFLHLPGLCSPHLSLWVLPFAALSSDSHLCSSLLYCSVDAVIVATFSILSVAAVMDTPCTQYTKLVVASL